MQSGAFSDSFEQFFLSQQNPHFTRENKGVKHVLDRI